MNNDEIRMFKLLLKRDYPYLIYKIEDCQNEIELLYHKMSGDKAISYGDAIGTTNQQAIEEYKLMLGEQISLIEKERSMYEERLKDIINILDKLDEIDRDMFNLKYMKHKTYYQIGKIYYLTASAVCKRMDKALEKI